MFARYFSIALCFLVAAPAGLTVLAGATDADLQIALKTAGDNRSQIEAAIAKVHAAQAEGLRFLVANMPDKDVRSLSTDYLVANVEYACRARDESPWKDRVSNEMFLNYVLPYAVVDEPREDWRKDLYDRCKPLVKGINEPGKAAVTLNQKLFPLLKVRFAANRRRANQGPLETIEAGNASCTGLSILLVDACRAVGVPARLVGIPMWTDKSGNHSWVEIWDGQNWRFTGAAEPTGNDLDSGWFAGRATSARRDDPIHAIYAARFARSPLVFPSAWSRRQGTVYAVNVTDRYTKSTKPHADDEIIVRFRVLDKPEGGRVAAKLELTTDDGKIVATGQTRDDQFDPNDHLEIVVKRQRPLRVRLRGLDREFSGDINPVRDQELFTYYLSDAEPQLPNWQKLSGAELKFAQSPDGRRLSEQLEHYFATKPGNRESIAFDPSLDELLLAHGSAIRKLAWKAYLAGREVEQLRAEVASNRVRYENHESPYVVRAVGHMPADGWPLVIAMHGGGGAPAEVNDSQWRAMQHYYRDQPSLEGYLYLAIRAPNNSWNGFYSPYNLGLTDRLIRQFISCANVDSNKIYLIGYSHGGYGAFYIGPRMPDRFAAIHASAAAPTDGNAVGKNLRNTPFTYMVGEHDLAHNRLTLCRDFEKYINSQRNDRHDTYPVTFEFKEGYPHSGLPDRDKIKDLAAAVRSPVPRELVWQLTHKEVDSLNWLHVPDPVVGMEVSGKCADNAVSITTHNIQRLDVLVDERLVAYDKPLVMTVNGQSTSKSLQPSLITLCETLAKRGDPEFMFATRVSVTAQP
jgi:pimeloyl-ACP methyl ester carboxylesterase